MTAADSELLRISTDDLPERDRLEFAREVHGRIIIKHEVEPIPGEPLYLRGTLRRLPNLAIASLACSAVHTNRTSAQIENDDFVLCVNLAGSRVLRQLGREAVLRQGEAVLSTSADVGTCDISSNSRWISVRTPFATLAPMVADIHSALIRPIPAGTEPLALLVSYIETLREMDALATPELRRLVVTHVNELVALTIGAKSDAAEFARGHGLRAARLVRVFQLIDDGILNPGLSTASVAVQLGVTPRYVQLLLEESGQTFTQHVLRRRLEKAKELLVRDVDQNRKIAAIALEVGFADLSHFNRAFRSYFGDTPSGVRANSVMRRLKN